MNQEQNTPADQNDGKIFLTTDSSLETQDEFEKNNAKGADDYYAVDDSKKDISTNIGDGEMHNEGLVGEGAGPDENIFSSGSTDQQDEAENHDSEG